MIISTAFASLLALRAACAQTAPKTPDEKPLVGRHQIQLGSRLHLTKYERWGSPLFFAGESYGTTRAAGLSVHLIERGSAFNGIVLMSTVLNFETILFTKGNDLPYDLFLSTYTATAWYHHKLAPDLQKDLPATLRETERQGSIDKLARHTGLDKKYIDDSDLRIETFHFTKELLGDRKRTVGRIDSRFTGIDQSAVSERPDYDPSIAVIRPPYTAAFKQYIRGELGYRSELEYYADGLSHAKLKRDVEALMTGALP